MKRCLKVILTIAAAAAVTWGDAVAGGQRRGQRPAETQLYATAGSEFNLYFDNLDWPGAVRYQMDAPGGRLEDDRWTYVPEKADRIRLTVRGFDAAGRQIREDRFMLNVAPGRMQPRRISMLFVGDSLTDQSVYPGHVVGRLASAGVTADSVGSHCGGGRKPDGRATPHEGRGGWKYGDYLTRWTDGSDYRARSPFLAGPGRMDIPGYFARYNHGKAPDVILIFLGGNDVANLKEHNRRAGVAQAVDNAEKLVQAFIDASPGSRVGLALLPPSAPKQEAFGRNYGMMIDRDTFVKNRRELLSGLLSRFAGRGDVSIVPTHLSLDCARHYPQADEPASAGSSVKVRRYTNALHPTPDGYRQIGDVIANWILAEISQSSDGDAGK